MILERAPFSSCDNIPAQPLSSAHCSKDSGNPPCRWLPDHSPEYKFTPTANRFSVLAHPDKSSTYSPWHSNASTSNANPRRRRKRAGKRHKIQRKSAGIARLRTTESIVALGHKIPTQCLEDNSSSATGDPRDLNQSRYLPDVTSSLCFAINSSDWPPQLQSDTLPTTLPLTNPSLPSVKSCSSVETTLASNSQPSRVPQRQPRLFTLSQFLDCNDATGRWPSKSAFPQPLVTTEVSQGSNSLAESAPLFLARQKELAVKACGHAFKRPLSPILSPEDAFDSHQAVLAILGLEERPIFTAPSQVPELKPLFKPSTQRFMDALPVSVPIGNGTEGKHAKETYRRRPVPLSCLQAFGGFRSLSNPLLHYNWMASQPTTSLPPPWSVSHPLLRAYPTEPYPFLHSDPPSMGCLNAYCPMTATFTCPCLSQNSESRGGSFPYLAGSAGNLSTRHDSGWIVRPGVMSTPTEPTTSRSPDEVRAQQVDSIFANRNPRANGRLRSCPPITSRYCLDYWMRVGSQGWEKDICSPFETPNQELEAEEEWVSISRETDQQQNEDNIDDTLNREMGKANVNRVDIMVRSTAFSASAWIWRGECMSGIIDCAGQAGVGAWSWINSRNHVLLLNGSDGNNT
ncbi:hypothetical protein COCMIDRAFT_36400 [Bipolaris oryzae ATCC 44560]|uniref:Uncharacterized protein n=1 Tax=Bipolaris oryzae ATCC 44560 TaxID=930090 RepID=W6ZQ91_COCMI|nr:uncharacterized protein COCMIDRAFT_36400 [Bipolaris oryzae ATCC 44560]EUC45891.1 hypothetical protein COCMIDRAFT_36400 [Bipolaris oryzae ATCC 44560]